MKITLIHGAVPGFDNGLNSAVKIIGKTLEELGENMAEINLMHEDIPYYDGEASSAMQKLSARLKASDGIILAFTANLFAPAACMQNFFEHLSYKAANKCLKDKNIFIVTASAAGGEAEALTYAGRVIRYFGGYDAVRLGLNAALLKTLELNQTLRESIEKYTEDYYRIIRQNRKFILPCDFILQPAPAEILEDEYKELLDYDKEKAEEKTPEDLDKKYNFSKFTERQEEDVREITQFFAGKYKENVNITPNSHIVSSGSIKSDIPPAPRSKTLKQTTQALPHHFKGQQFAPGQTAIIQMHITGAEGFDGYLTVVNHECEYLDGTTENPDLTIICESGVWADVLKGKYSAQKAFMVGYLKVRGNFVLLTKFDQAFSSQV